ncbi:MAG: UvrD-helicase domain-containing protein [Bryobacteraceae bacterium]
MTELLPLDFAEREQAIATDRSFIVKAPAGSGKTGLLVQRILALLGQVERPESVVAMTFTIKAGAEMRERVIRALEQAEEARAVTGAYAAKTRELALRVLSNDRSRGWNLLSDPSRLQILTIDALCAMLVRQMPIVSESGGVGPVLEDATEFYRLAARRMLQTLAENGDSGRALLGRVALYFDNDMVRLEKQVASMLAKRDQWHTTGSQEGTVLSDFLWVLQEAEVELGNVFREEGIVDFQEITRAATLALGEPESPSDLLYSLDYRIEHILVDEFQDTSRAQHDLLNALTGQWSDGDGRTLFLVGDPVQSIYGFRAAEVALFMQAWEDERLGAVRLTPLRLQTNFRSTPAIVKWIERSLSPVMAITDKGKGAVQLESAVSSRSESGNSPQLIPLIDDKSGANEAEKIVEILKNGRNTADCAILVRSRSHVISILPALRQAGIPYQAIEIDELKDQQHVLDMLALTRAVLHLADRTSWLACLRAPWCGLTSADLSALAERHRERTIFDLLRDLDVLGSLTPDGRERAIRVAEIMDEAVAAVGRFDLRSLIERTWYALGGPSALRETNQYKDAQTFFSLLESFEHGGTIRDFSLLSERLQKLYAAPSGEEHAVRIMTVHEAKGLEFDTVILPQLGKWPASDDDELVVWNKVVGEHGTSRVEVAVQPQKGVKDPDYTRIKAEAKEKVRNEGKRLFYVACTRAKNRLFLLGSVNRTKNGSDVCKAAEHTFLGMIWAQYKHDFQLAMHRMVPTQPSLFGAAEAKSQTIRRLPANWNAPELSPALSLPDSVTRAAASERPVTFEWVSGLGRHVGTVVHQFLKRASDSNDPLWLAQPSRALEALVREELARLGVRASQQGEAAGRVMKALQNTLSSKRGKWILRSANDAHSEWPLEGIIGDKLITGTVDRAFRDEEGRFWIIDFKTSEHRGGNLEYFLGEEQRRYRSQMENYATLVSRLVEGPIWLGLYFPLLDAWREWPFAEVASAYSAGSELATLDMT